MRNEKIKFFLEGIFFESYEDWLPKLDFFCLLAFLKIFSFFVQKFSKRKILFKKKIGFIFAKFQKQFGSLKTISICEWIDCH